MYQIVMKIQQSVLPSYNFNRCFDPQAQTPCNISTLYYFCYLFFDRNRKEFLSQQLLAF